MSAKKTSILSACFLAIIATFAFKAGFLVETAHAIPIIPGQAMQSTGTLGDVLKDLMQKIAMVNTFMHVLLLIILQFLQYLLQADFFNNPDMMNGLFTIWKLCRDIMNIVFALSLIGVSFYVIITGKSDMIKEKLSQFVIAVILVNFSWFFPRVIIDVANVLTATIYSVPTLLPAPLNTCETPSPTPGGSPVPCKVVTAVLIFPKDEAEMDDFCSDNGGGAAFTAACPCIDKLECHVLKDYSSVSNMKAAHSMINAMAISFARITELATIPRDLGAGAAPIGTASAVRTSLQIGLSIMMALLVQIAVVLPLLGMAVGFLIRIIILWVTTAFMPLTFFGYLKDGKLGTAVFGFEIDIWKEFLNAAFLPATVGAPFVIGFIMLTTVSQVPAPGNMPFDIGVPMISNVKSWWAMLWLFAAVGIIWKGSFSALSRSKFIGEFTEKIRGFGESIGGGIARLPLITPLPLPGLPNANLGTVLHTPKIFSDVIRNQSSGGSRESFGDALNRAMGGNAGNNAGGAGGNGPGGVDTDKFARELNNRNDENTRKLIEAIQKLDKPGERANAMVTIQQVLGRPGISERDSLDALREIANKQASGPIRDLQQKIEEEFKKVNP